MFEMTDLGRMAFFLACKYFKKKWNNTREVQHGIIYKPTTTPMNYKEKFCKEDEDEKMDEKLYRSLLWRYMHYASEIHFKATKRI